MGKYDAGLKVASAIAKASAEAEALAKLDAGKKLSKAENVAAGLYHPIGEGKKLSRPFSRMTSKTIDNPDVVMHKGEIITPERAVKEKMGFFPLIGDRAATGKILTHINDHELTHPVNLTGGGKYMQANYDPLMEQSAAWESGQGKVTHLSNRIEDIANSGYEPVGIYSPGSHVQVDFNTMMAPALLNQFDPTMTTKKLIKQFDKKVRSFYPDFAGITSPEAEAQLLDKKNGVLRTAFSKVMNEDPYQAGGFPDVPSVRKAISEPELHDTEIGDVGMTMAKFDPERRIVTPKHPSSYPIPMAGQNLGSLDEPTNFRDFFTTHAERRRLLGSPASSDYRSYELAQPIQYADQEWLDKVMKAREARDKLIRGEKKGGHIKIKNLKKQTKVYKMADGGRAPDMEYINDPAVKPYAFGNKMNMAGNEISNADMGIQHEHSSGRIAGGISGTQIKNERDTHASHSLFGEVQQRLGEISLRARAMKPTENDSVMGHLSASMPLAGGQASVGVAGSRMNGQNNLNAINAGYNRQIGDGNLNVNFTHTPMNKSNRVDVMYQHRFAEGGEVDDSYTDPMGNVAYTGSSTPDYAAVEQNAKHTAEILARMAKEQARHEALTLKKPADFADVVNKGVIADTLGAPVDIINMGLKGIDTLAGTKLSTEKPFAGSESIRQGMKNLGVAQEQDRPMSEIMTGIFGPGVVMKSLRSASKAMEAGKSLPMGLSIENVGAPMSEVLAPKKLLAPADELGFYSNVEKAGLNLQRNKGNGQAFLNDLSKQAGVSKEELDAMGLPQYLRDKPAITKQELQDYIKANRIRPTETVLGEKSPNRWEGSTIFKDNKPVADVVETSFGYSLRYPDPTKPNGYRYEALGTDSRYNAGNIAVQRLGLTQAQMNSSTSKAQFAERFRTPGGENYREILLKGQQPEKVDPKAGYDKLSKELFGKDSFDDLNDIEKNLVARRANANQFDYYSNQYHWPREKNIIASLRVDDRIDKDGKAGLLVDELQSDVHQKGREHGYRTRNEVEAYHESLRKRAQAEHAFEAFKKDNPKPQTEYYGLKDPSTGERVGDIKFDNKWDALEYLDKTYGRLHNRNEIAPVLDKYFSFDDEFKKWKQTGDDLYKQVGLTLSDSNRLLGRMENKVPNLPYRENYHELALKRAIREAAEKGQERIYLPTGSDVAKRYDLAKQLDKVNIRKYGDQWIIEGYKGRTEVLNHTAEGDAQLAEAVGKELATKAIQNNGGTFEGLDLEVGGKGMKKYYDEVYPAFLKKFAKKYGGVTGETSLSNKDQMYSIGDLLRKNGMSESDWQDLNYDQKNELLNKWTDERRAEGIKVRYYELTPEAREKVLKGLPLRKGGLVGFGNGGMVMSDYNTRPDFNDGGSIIFDKPF